MSQLSKGAAGEVLAARFLREKKYGIIAANVQNRFGEIDIVASTGKYIVFVEVKTRNENAIYAPRESVTAEKQRRIIRAALGYLKAHPTKLQPRFDVIEIITKRDDPMKVVELDHIENAFEAGDLHESV